MHGNRPAGVFLLLLLAAASSPAIGAYGVHGVTSHAAAAGSRVSARLRTASTTRLLEDEVAPELSWSAASLLGNKGIGESALHATRAQCVSNCAAKGPGDSYTRDCTYVDKCRH
jgi:hypothetical protein